MKKNRLLLLVMLFLIGIPSVLALNLGDGLIMAYQFNETGGKQWRDSTGQHANMTSGVNISALVGFSSTATNASGTANGNGQYLTTNDITWNGTIRNLTTSMWIKLTNNNTLLTPSIITWVRNVSNATGSNFGINTNSTGSLTISASDGSDGSCGQLLTGFVHNFGGKSIRDEQWHHLVTIRDNLNFTVYLDGYFYGNVTIKADANTECIIMGYTQDQLRTSTNFNGTIDEWYFYNRILNTSEILGLNNSGIANNSNIYPFQGQNVTESPPGSFSLTNNQPVNQSLLHGFGLFGFNVTILGTEASYLTTFQIGGSIPTPPFFTVTNNSKYEFNLSRNPGIYQFFFNSSVDDVTNSSLNFTIRINRIPNITQPVINSTLFAFNNVSVNTTVTDDNATVGNITYWAFVRSINGSGLVYNHSVQYNNTVNDSNIFVNFTSFWQHFDNLTLGVQTTDLDGASSLLFNSSTVGEEINLDVITISNVNITSVDNNSVNSRHLLTNKNFSLNITILDVTDLDNATLRFIFNGSATNFTIQANNSQMASITTLLNASSESTFRLEINATELDHDGIPHGYNISIAILNITVDFNNPTAENLTIYQSSGTQKDSPLQVNITGLDTSIESAIAEFTNPAGNVKQNVSATIGNFSQSGGLNRTAMFTTTYSNTSEAGTYTVNWFITDTAGNTFRTNIIGNITISGTSGSGGGSYVPPPILHNQSNASPVFSVVQGIIQKPSDFVNDLIIPLQKLPSSQVLPLPGVYVIDADGFVIGFRPVFLLAYILLFLVVVFALLKAASIVAVRGR